MAIIESCLTILGAVSGSVGLHSWFTGLKTGEQIQKTLDEQKLIRSEIKRLSDHILYTPSIQQVRTLNEPSSQIKDLRRLREILDPVQHGLKEDILSTAIISTPEELKKAFNKDPWEVLIETRPVARTKRPDNPDLVAILFTDSGISYIGWQTKGALPILFGCDYFSDINKSNFIGNGKESSNRSSEKSAHTNSLGMKFVYIPPGTFMMGSPESEKGRYDDEFQHEVTLTKGFYMQTTEVTQGQWQIVMGNNPSYFKDCGDDCPVESVSWNDAQEFIEKLNQKEKGSQYRLPTEAEWEYACRAGTETRFYTGNSEADLDRAGWYSKNSGEKTHPVGRKEPNGFGLYDMHGNVWEWCQDWYGDYLTGSVIDPKGTSSGPYRVLRGGSWILDGGSVRSAARVGSAPSSRLVNDGLRLARGQQVGR